MYQVLYKCQITDVSDDLMSSESNLKREKKTANMPSKGNISVINA